MIHTRPATDCTPQQSTGAMEIVTMPKECKRPVADDATQAAEMQAIQETQSVSTCTNCGMPFGITAGADINDTSCPHCHDYEMGQWEDDDEVLA